MSDEKISLSAPPVPQVQPQDFAIPTEVIPLPSEGRAYPPGHPLHGKTSLEIRSMTARDEDILTSRALIRSGRVVGSLIRSCVLDKTIDPDSMLSGDRNAVLIGIRITGYGPGYPVKFNCPSCDVEVKHEVDLTQLPLKRIPQDINASSNAFSVILPVSKKTCVFKLLTGIEEQDLMQQIERGRKTAGAEELVTSRLKRQVIEISGERDPQRLSALINNLPARDSRELRKAIDKITPGVELKTSFTCAMCGMQGEVDVPLGTEFFWPEA